MGIKNKLNHQEYVYDFSVLGGAVASYNMSGNLLPLGAVVLKCQAVVETAFTSGGAATLSIGDSASATKYAAATAVASLVDGFLLTEAGVPNTVSASNERQVVVAIAAAAMTAGKLRIMIDYAMGDE
jgi:hypothetical protein